MIDGAVIPELMTVRPSHPSNWSDLWLHPDGSACCAIAQSQGASLIGSMDGHCLDPHSNANNKFQFLLVVQVGKLYNAALKKYCLGQFYLGFSSPTQHYPDGWRQCCIGQSSFVSEQSDSRS